MARPVKANLDFFPFDVTFFTDDKLDDVQNEYGPLGEAIYLRLLCFIYGDKGYYYEFESLDKVANRIIRSIGNRWVRNKEYVIKVISYLAECNLFSKELMRNNILTSVGIQRRYVYVMGKILKRQVRIKKYNLLEKTVFDNGLEVVPENEVNSEETGVNSEETTGLFGENDTKSKVNKNNIINQNETDESKSAEGGLRNSDPKNDFDNAEYRHLLVDDYGEDTVVRYEKKFDEWVKGKKTVNVNKYFEIDKWLLEDFG